MYFEQAQWNGLMVFTTGNRVTPEQPPTLRDAIRRVATMGGFLGRKVDGETGTQILWFGLHRLDDINVMSQFMRDAIQVPVSS